MYVEESNMWDDDLCFGVFRCFVGLLCLCQD